MRRLTLHLAAAVLPVAAVAAALPPLSGPPPRAAQDASAEESKVELLLSMKEMDELGKSLRRSVRKVETHPQALQEVAEYQRHCVLVKSLPPPMLATVPEGERAAFLRDYRKGMVEVLVELCNLESALLDGDVDQARELLKVLKELEAAGHERFMPEEG